MSKRRALELAGIIRRYDILKEDEMDDLFGGEDDEGGDDGGGDEEGGEEDDGGDVDEGGDEADGDEEPEEEPIESLTPDEIAKYGPGEIEKVVDEKIEGFFSSSQKSAAVRQSVSAGYPGHADEEEEDGVVESFLHRQSLGRLLLEEEGEPAEGEAIQAEIDLVSFSSDVHNLMMNYENLLDMEGMIFTKARQFLINQLGEEAADEMEELLALRHGWDPEEKYDISGSQNTMVAPPAAGAMTGGAPAA